MDEHRRQKTLDDRARMEVRALAILGLQPGASCQELRRVFRRAARRQHPDQNPGDPGAEERFRDVVAAYRFLVRAQPDRRLLGQSEETVGTLRCGYRLDNTWGYFLWWRESFF